MSACWTSAVPREFVGTDARGRPVVVPTTGRGSIQGDRLFSPHRREVRPDDVFVQFSNMWTANANWPDDYSVPAAFYGLYLKVKKCCRGYALCAAICATRAGDVEIEVEFGDSDVSWRVVAAPPAAPAAPAAFEPMLIPYYDEPPAPPAAPAAPAHAAFEPMLIPYDDELLAPAAPAPPAPAAFGPMLIPYDDDELPAAPAPAAFEPMLIPYDDDELLADRYLLPFEDDLFREDSAADPPADEYAHYKPSNGSFLIPYD